MRKKKSRIKKGKSRQEEKVQIDANGTLKEGESTERTDLATLV